MAKIFYVIGRQEIFYSGTLKQCRELLKDCYENYPDHIDSNCIC